MPAQLGRSLEARRLLEELAARHPADFPLLLELGQLLLEEGDAVAAESWLRQALRHSPHDYQAHYALADSLRRQGKHEEEAQDTGPGEGTGGRPGCAWRT